MDYCFGGREDGGFGYVLGVGGEGDIIAVLGGAGRGALVDAV